MKRSLVGAVALAIAIVVAAAVLWKVPGAGARLATAGGILSAGLVGIVQGLPAWVSGLLTIPVLVLLALLLFRTQVIELLTVLIAAMRDRGVTIDVGSFSVAVTERTSAQSDEVLAIYSHSPFEIEEDVLASPTLADITPQLTFHVSDTVGRFWEGRDPEPAKRMRDALRRLRSDCATKRTFDEVRPALNAYVDALEEARFREAGELADLVEECQLLRAGIAARQPRDLANDAADFRVLHALGVACAQRETRVGDALATLDKIAWQGDAVHYVPAGSMWIAAKYHVLLTSLAQTAGDLRFDAAEVVSAMDDLFTRGGRVLDAITTWGGAGTKASKGFYLREAHKHLGEVESLFADHGPADRRRGYLDRATVHLRACAETLDGNEVPSPLDHNNLADLYRQLGEEERKRHDDEKAARFYRDANESMRRCLADAPDDPTFQHTFAMVLYSQGRIRDAYLALAGLPQPGARDDRQDREQYFDNQILAARLLVALHRDKPAVGFAAAVDVLVSALDLLGGARGTLSRAVADRLERQIQELLGYAWLQLPRTEEEAARAFERRLALRSPDENARQTLSAHLGAATAFGRYARVLRHRDAAVAARTMRDRANDSVAFVLKALDTQPITADAVRDPRHRGVWLDGLRAVQLMAEERFGGFEEAQARELVDRIALSISSLAAALDDLAPSDERRLAVRRLAARHALLDARLIVRADPMLNAADTATKAETAVAMAFGVSPQFTCEAWLELGNVRLETARFGKSSNPERDYRAALAAFEHAVATDVPALRAEAFRQLTRAQSMRHALIRKAPAAEASAKK